MKLLLEHLPPSLAIGLAGWWLSGDPLCLAAALAAGWLIDADHLVDFAWYLHHAGKSADWGLLKSGGYFKRNGKVMVPLHAWEITLALTAMSLVSQASFWPWASAAMAHGIHLWQDQTAYRVRRYGYWLTSRLGGRFSHNGFCR